MHRILAFIHDADLGWRLEQAQRQGGNFEVVFVETIDDAIGQLRDNAYAAVLVGDRAGQAEPVKRAKLLRAGGNPATEVWAIGETQFDELPQKAHLSAAADIQRLVDVLNKRTDRGARADSSSYFVSDTQEGRVGRGLENLDLDNPNSTAAQRSVDGARMLYVGGGGDFRRSLEQAAADHHVELDVADHPEAVEFPTGAPAVDNVVIAVEFELRAVRKLVGFLRRRQPLGSFDVLLMVDGQSSLAPGVARSFGADAVIERPEAARALISNLGERRPNTCTDVLIVAAASRHDLYHRALGGEPVDAVYADSAEAAEAAFDDRVPEMVVIDACGGECEVGAIARDLQRQHPFCAAAFVGINDTGNSNQRSVDDMLQGPVLPADIRRLVRLYAASIEYGRVQCRRDALTGVNSALELTDHLQSTIDEARGTQTSAVLTAIDVDDLSDLNRRYGTAVGDSVLRSLAEVLCVAVGDRQAVYRTVADEFFVLQRATDGQWERLRDRLERTLAAFRQQTFRSADGRGTYATVSMGALVIPSVAVSAEYCLQKCWVVLGRACARAQQTMLVARIDASRVPVGDPSTS